MALLALSPIIVLLARLSRRGALAFSLAIYVAALVFEINLPTWPVEGTWFFNPFAWQLLLALGFLSCEWSRESETFRRWTVRLMPLGLVGVAVGAIVACFDLKPDPFLGPEPRLLFIFDK